VLYYIVVACVSFVYVYMYEMLHSFMVCLCTTWRHLSMAVECVCMDLTIELVLSYNKCDVSYFINVILT